MSRRELEGLLEQERELVFPRFTADDAWTLGSWLVRTARERSLPVAIDIERAGLTLFRFACEGARPDNAEWIRRKAAAVHRFGHSSFYLGRLLASLGKTIEEKFLVSEADFAPHGGAFPLIVRDVGPVGHVAVSGLPQEDDHALVVESLRALLSGMRPE